MTSEFFEKIKIIKEFTSIFGEKKKNNVYLIKNWFLVLWYVGENIQKLIFFLIKNMLDLIGCLFNIHVSL